MHLGDWIAIVGSITGILVGDKAQWLGYICNWYLGIRTFCYLARKGWAWWQILLLPIVGLVLLLIESFVSWNIKERRRERDSLR